MTEEKLYEIRLNEWQVGYLLGLLESHRHPGGTHPKMREVKEQLDSIVEDIQQARAQFRR